MRENEEGDRGTDRECKRGERKRQRGERREERRAGKGEVELSFMRGSGGGDR